VFTVWHTHQVNLGYHQNRGAASVVVYSVVPAS